MDNYTLDNIANPYKEFTFSIANGQRQSIFYTFNFIQILAISATTGVELRFGGSGTPSTIVGAGVSYETPNGAVLSRVEIYNGSGGVLTGTFGLCLGKIRDSRFSTSSAVTITEKAPTIRSTADTALSTTAAQVLAADTSRREAIITNLSTTIDVYVGDSSVTSSRKGVVLKPAQAVTLSTTAAVYALSASGTPSVSLLEVLY